jgi:Cobalamin biosynthesis protein CobT (nicotinate-mononucleotide:5, 6-dimethylbenzimidazole phosphoribosyltransferase)
MKKVFLAAFFILVFVAACSNNSSSSVYGGLEDEGEDDGGYSEVPDSDRGGYERPDDAPVPGGGGSNGNGNPGGSTGSKDDDSAVDDGDSETDDEEVSDHDENGGNDEDNTPETPDENGNNEKPDGNNDDNAIYALEPDVESCTSGIPSDNEKQKVLNRINYLRAIHNLKPVQYNDAYDEIAGECALVIAANNNLSHTPDSSWKCWSQFAYDGCYSSNINIAMTTNIDTYTIDSSTIVDGFMTEENEVPPVTLGHRRWFIDPWLKTIAFGRADYSDGAGHFVLGSAVRVINRDDPDDQQDISDTDIKFVAYPFENYPAELYNDNVMMSFTVIKDKFSKYSNGTGITFSTATIAIIDPDNKTMKVKNIEFDTEGYGVPNNLRWYVEGIQPNTKYNVTISNVMINNNSEFYQYWFELK